MKWPLQCSSKIIERKLKVNTHFLVVNIKQTYEKHSSFIKHFKMSLKNDS